MSKNHKISALIITYNEEKNITNIIDSLDFVDEIIVVDSFSTDKTQELIQTKQNVNFVQNKFENFAQQRNYALSLARNNWILFLDADEKLTNDLKEEILTIVSNENQKAAYYFKRIFMFKECKLHFSGWQNDKVTRLFQKDKAYYNNEKLVHEKLIIDGEIGICKNKLVHFSYDNFNDYKNKMAQYGKLKAFEARYNNTTPNLYHLYIRPLYQFLYQYLIRLGILDGQKGIIISYLNAYSVYTRFQEVKKNNSRKIKN